jgi:hypothetical protein
VIYSESMNIPGNEVGIAGSGTNYYDHMDGDVYASKINTPARSSEYFEQFHLPIIETAHARNLSARVTVLDIACGPAFELDFVMALDYIDAIATDISPAILPEVQKRLGKNALVFASDSSDSALRPNIADAGMIVNAMVYVPDKMLGAMENALKPGAECAVNFRDFGNPHNDAFYKYYTDRGGVILDRQFTVEADDSVNEFGVKVLEYKDCVNDDGTADKEIRKLGQQLYFASVDDIVRFVGTCGMDMVKHDKFDFSSPVNDHNQIDVFTLQKPS